ncbi:MAG: NADH-quinone oxidoreductase subunit J [Chloroflexi bacterium]|nr:NADH-quinone oxidoreductase subunit J [Chloroflexota bacterium]
MTLRNLFHAALAMMLSFLGVAALYITLDAGFMAAAQLLVYIGAISILIIFAIMLTRRMMQTHETAFNSQMLGGAFTAVVSFLVLAFVMVRLWGNNPAFQQPPEIPAEVMSEMVTLLGFNFVNANGYVIPFILASMLLLAALIGSIYVAWPQTEDEA